MTRGKFDSQPIRLIVFRAAVSCVAVSCAVCVALCTAAPAGAQATISPTRPAMRGPVDPALSCTAETLNISGLVGRDGSIVVFNVPADQGDLRLRVTCEDPLGNSVSGASPLISPVADGVTVVPSIDFEDVAPVASRLTTTPADVRLVGAGTSLQLAVSASFADGTSGDVTSASSGTTYTTSNPDVVTVGADGLLAARGTGTAVVGVLNEGAVGFSSVSVLSAELEALEVVPPQVALVASPLAGVPRTPLAAAGRLADDTTTDLTPAASGTTYVSSNPSVAFVDSGGTVAGLAAGRAEITVSNAGVSTSVEVTVDDFTPIPTRAVNTPGTAHEVDIAGSLVFIADGGAGLAIVEAEGASLATVAFPGASAIDVKVRGELAAVALGEAGVALVDVADPGAAAEVSRIATGGSARDLWLSGDRLYVATGAGLEVHDVADPAAPALVATQSFASPARAVAADSARGVVVVLTAQPALAVLDTSGGLPAPVATVALPAARNQADDVALFGTSAYVANGRAGIHEVDVTDPSSPTPRSNTSLSFNALGVAARPLEGGTLVAAADNFFVNAVPLFDAALRNTFTVDFSKFPSVVRADANSVGVALGDTFGAVATGPDGIQIFRTVRRVDNAGVPPVVSLVDPVDGSESAQGLRLVHALAADDVQVASVEFLRDGEVVSTDATPPFIGVFEAGPDGTEHVLEARAVDLAGNLGVSLPVRVRSVGVPVRLVNLALNKTATQSSTAYRGVASRAVDANAMGAFGQGSVTHTGNNTAAWWQVDLGAVHAIRSINVFNRTDCCGERLSDFHVMVSEQPFPADLAGAEAQSTWHESFSGRPGVVESFTVGASGRYVRVQLPGQNYLSLAEVEVIGFASGAVDQVDPCGSTRGEEWVPVFRHDSTGGYFRGAAQAARVNADQDPATVKKFSRLSELENLRGADGSFHFKLVYPELGSGFNEWKQSSNPLTTQDSVTDYQAVQITWTAQGWGGLARSSSPRTFIDGSVGSTNWFYSIGSNTAWNGAVPGPSGAVHQVELYACGAPLPPKTCSQEWVPVFRHDSTGGYFTGDAEAASVNADQDPATVKKFSRLSELENLRGADGNFHFKLYYPELGAYNEWKQSSNPLTTQESVTDYQAVHISWTTRGWGGLAKSSRANTFLDGTAGLWWYYSIGSTGAWNGGMPGPSGAVHQVELYACGAPLPPTQ